MRKWSFIVQEVSNCFGVRKNNNHVFLFLSIELTAEICILESQPKQQAHSMFFSFLADYISQKPMDNTDFIIL